MVYLKKTWYWICTPYRKWKEEKEFQKKIKELQKKDPFIYK